MAESIKKIERWNTRTLCEVFNIEGATILEIEYETLSYSQIKPVWGFEKNHIPWNKGRTNCYSKETLNRMKEISKGRDMSKAIKASVKKTKGKPAHNKGVEYPHLQKGGKIISKEGHIIEFQSISKISKQLNLNPSHLGQVSSGKRKSHKGWKNAS